MSEILNQIFRTALSEIKELGVYTDMNTCRALINKGKYVGQDILNAIRICKALLKITGVFINEQKYNSVKLNMHT